ncbi:hypothetical protein MY1884_008286 [Beauveria asiatica]
MSQAEISGISTPREPSKPADAPGHTVASSKVANALATKVSAVLSASYTDAEFRGAVALIEHRGLKHDGRTRRRLRLELQKEVIEKNGKILDGFGFVSDKLNADSSEMKRMVAAAHSGMESPLAEVSALLEKRRGIEWKRHLLQILRERFVLSDEEELTLTSAAEPVDEVFFACLAKAKKITQECEVLLGFEKQTLASEIMEKSSKTLGYGYQKLYKWIQREFKTLNVESPQINATMRKALTVLAARPSLFQNSLDFFADGRQHILSDSFFTALTGNGSGRGSAAAKPIDMIAHDPLRYVGDMLAWVHSAAVSEREILEVLFVADSEELVKGINSSRDAELWRIISDGEDEDFNTLKALNNLVDRDVSGAARLLRQRVEQVIQSNEDSIVAFKLGHLLKFYGVMLLKLLGPGCSLLDSVRSLEKEAMRQFRALLREHIAAVRAEPQSMPSDLDPPVFLQDALKQIQIILSTCETSLSTAEESEESIDQVLAEAVDPFILDSEALAKSMPTLRRSIYLINCRLALANCFKKSNLVKEREEQLVILIDEEAAILTDSQLAFFHRGSGLYDLITIIKQRANFDADSITADKLSASSTELDHFLPSAYIDALERLGELQDSGLARKITEEAAERFCEDFELLEKRIDALDTAQSGGEDDDNLRSVFPRTVDEIREMRGDETEALRHWRNALALIYEHNATKANPGYGPQTDTEKALVDALRELELQYDSGERSERRSASEVPIQRKAATRRTDAIVATQSTVFPDQVPRHRRRDQPMARHVSVSSTSGDDVDSQNVKSLKNKTPVNHGTSVHSNATLNKLKPSKRKVKEDPVKVDSSSEASEETEESIADKLWKKKKSSILRNLPPGVDESAAKQILNDIVVKGDEVRWGDIAGLEIAKNALRETVVYPFLRPDLFMGLREPARGMLLFGPPGTGKTMLARAVATESRSTFFSISASSLTSKYLGESEKLVRALFGLARSLAPSIIFVDEIDALLSQRSGSGEHEATRRIKTEFLIQWSDLQRAAAGRETTERDRERGDANRVLVLAATNLPWAIDEAARRRFVRRQYIPLPEPTTRETQIRTLLGQQKHSLSPRDVQRLVGLTDGFSGSDITALAKDAAMGPLRSLGEALLHMTMDEIRPISLVDFEASLRTIRPSVSKSGLKEYEDWANEFGERGG